MSATEIKLYDFFRKDLKLDDSRAKVFTEVLYESIETQTNKTATEYKSLFKEDLLKLDIKIAESKSDMIKWFGAFFATIMLMILGLYATILLK
jgi:hypothetical protein